MRRVASSHIVRDLIGLQSMLLLEKKTLKNREFINPY